MPIVNADAVTSLSEFTRAELILIALEVCLLLCHFRLYFVMTSTLRNRHPEIWQSLGSPSLLSCNSPAATSKMTAYVFSGRYRELNDGVFSAAARQWKAVAVLFITGILALTYEFLRYGP
jgi:hypothetical protein